MNTIRKLRKITRNLFLGLGLVMSTLFLTECNKPTEDAIRIYDSETVIRNFEEVFCRNGELMGVQQNPSDIYTRTVAVEDPRMPSRIFSAITGVDLNVSQKYSVTFESADGGCELSITGNTDAADGIYATMLVRIAGYPQVKRILMVDTEILNDSNEIVTDGITGHPSKAL